MSSTLWKADHLAPVVSLADVRGHSVGDTLMVRCFLLSDDTVYRWIGIHEHTTVAQCRRVVATVFNIDGDVGSEASGDREIADVLRQTGHSTSFHWGLWEFVMQLADVYQRDASTPPSVCVAGSGAFGATAFDIRAVNAELLGAQRVRDLEELVRADARDVISRATTHDFLPLIQALGVERELGAGSRVLGADETSRLAELPRETLPEQRDAFWATVLANACFAGEDVTERLTESIMTSLGWPNMRAAEIRELCTASLAELDAISLNLPLPQRLDIYRDLLRG